MKRVIGYRQITKTTPTTSRVGYEPIYETFPPVKEAPVIPIDEIPPLDARGRLWGREGLGRERG